MFNPSADDLALHSASELEAMARDARDKHTATLTEMATAYDESEKTIAELKANPRKLTAEVIVRDPDGKKVERWETPEAVDAASVSAALTRLHHQAMSGELVNRARRAVAETQARRSVLGRQIQEQREAFYRLERKLASAVDAAREREKQATGREIKARQHATQNRVPRSMTERLGLNTGTL